MGEITKIGMGNITFGLVVALDGTFESLREQYDTVTILGGVTGSGTVMSRAMLRQGFAVLVDDRVEMWHRDAILGKVERRSIGALDLEDVRAARIRRRTGGVEVRLLDGEEVELLRLNCAGEDDVADLAEAAVRAWLSGADVDADLFEPPTMGERRDAAVRGVRDTTRGVVGTFTLEEYRSVMDQAMEQVVEVLAVQSAELRAVQRRVVELERLAGITDEQDAVG